MIKTKNIQHRSEQFSIVLELFRIIHINPTRLIHNKIWFYEKYPNGSTEIQKWSLQWFQIQAERVAEDISGTVWTFNL